MKKEKTFQITPCPTREEISKAVEVLGDQWLHVYQLLYKNNLTAPEGKPLKVERIVSSNTTTQLKISHWVLGQGLHFGCFGWESDEEILKKARMLVDGAGKPRPFPFACCCYAKRISCVCNTAMKCEIHGESHVGSHD